MITTPGVHMILYRGENVALIAGEEIQAIQKAVDGSLCVEPHPYLKCGERVRVKRGSLEGVEGVLVRKKNLCRLVLSVNMVAQSVAVEIDAADVEPATVQITSATSPTWKPSGTGNFDSRRVPSQVGNLAV